jgi:DNA polymerase-3 subunit delta'
VLLLADAGENIATFEQLIGQSALTARLKASLERGRIAHAVLFAGPAGSGKRTAAGIWARALLCSSEGRKPCNLCVSCRKALDGNHPDLHVVKPEEGKALGVDEARNLQRLIELKPYEGGRAVVIVQDAHSLTPQAQNALLKTLEEPPENAVLMLLAESLSPLLPTILSRCAVYAPARLSRDDMARVLQSRGYGPGGRTEHAAGMADGRPGRALELLADEGYWPLRDAALDALGTLIREKRLAAAVKFMQDNRARAGDVLTVWECALRDALVARNAPGAPLLSGGFAVLKDVAAARLMDMLSACAAARKALDGNAIYAMAVDNLLIELSGGI